MADRSRAFQKWDTDRGWKLGGAAEGRRAGGGYAGRAARGALTAGAAVLLRCIGLRGNSRTRTQSLARLPENCSRQSRRNCRIFFLMRLRSDAAMPLPPPNSLSRSITIRQSFT